MSFIADFTRALVLAHCCVPSRDNGGAGPPADRKSTRLNSSHLGISYAVFCLKKKKKTTTKKAARNNACTANKTRASKKHARLISTPNITTETRTSVTHTITYLHTQQT